MRNGGSIKRDEKPSIPDARLRVISARIGIRFRQLVSFRIPVNANAIYQRDAGAVRKIGSPKG